jgi:hypothetical protein
MEMREVKRKAELAPDPDPKPSLLSLAEARRRVGYTYFCFGR